MKTIGLALVMLALPGAIWADDIETRQYICERGAVVAATYLNIAERSFAVLQFEGRQKAFESAVSASGARYVATGTGEELSEHPTEDPYIWWTKGDAATLSFGPPSDETVIYANCALQAAP